jgi:PAS domain S-box-containing protein
MIGNAAPTGNDLSPETLSTSFRKMERREWWLWSAAVTVTLVLTAGLASFLVPGLEGTKYDQSTSAILPQIVRSLVALVLIFDIYTLYKQLQIHRIRRQWVRREELFRLIGENAADLIAVVGVDGRRIFNSLSYEKVLGYTNAELSSSSSFEQIHPEDRDRVKEAAAVARRTGIGQPVEYRFRHKDGSWKVLESTASVIRNSAGEPDKLVIVNRDVTERKRAEEALKKSE